MSESTTSTQTQSLLNWLAEMRLISWRWLLGVGATISLAQLMLTSLTIALFAIVVTVPSDNATEANQSIVNFSFLAGSFLSPLISLALTFLGAGWLVRRVGVAPTQHGLLLGFLSSAWGVSQAVIFSGQPLRVFLDGFTLGSTAVFIFAGWLGARRGRATRATQQQLFAATQAVRRSQTPQEIVQAIGQHLARPELDHIGLWEVAAQASGKRITAVSLLAVWQADTALAWNSDTELTNSWLPTLSSLTHEPLALQASALSGAERSGWASLGIQSGLLLPLQSMAGDWVGILSITSSKTGGFGRGAQQDFLTVAEQVGLVLENLQLVSQAKETAVVHERERMAREIHDTLAQGFTSIIMNLEAAEQAMPTDTTISQHHLTQARQTARNSLAQARRVVADLRPDVLESAPLPAALERVAADWSAQSHIPAHLVTTGDYQPLHPQVEVTLLRATQEALNNIRKHARAKQASITLSYLGDTVILDVQDNGQGFDDSQPATPHANGGFGLLAMRERVDQLGGELSIESDLGEGTTVAVSIPIP